MGAKGISNDNNKEAEEEASSPIAGKTDRGSAVDLGP